MSLNSYLSQMAPLPSIAELLSSNDPWLVYVPHRILNESLLATDLTHRGHQFCMCLSTTASDLLVSPKDPRLWNEVSSTSAYTINGQLSSGCRLTSRRSVEILARYVLGPSSSLRIRCHRDTIGYGFRRERRSNVSLLSLPQR